MLFDILIYFLAFFLLTSSSIRLVLIYIQYYKNGYWLYLLCTLEAFINFIAAIYFIFINKALP